MAETTVRSFLDRLMSEGQRLVSQGEDAAAGRLGVGADPASRARLRETGLAGGAAMGLAAMLLGGRRRGFGRNALLMAGAGALGKIAMGAWSKGQGATSLPGVQSGAAAIPGGSAADRSYDALADDEAEERARTLLLAMVAAAKADGHIDEEEESAIEAEMEDLPVSVREMLAGELRRPADPEAIAARARGEHERREIYAASALLCGRDNPLEVAYLDRLASALGLAPGEARDIEEGLGAV